MIATLLLGFSIAPQNAEAEDDLPAAAESAKPSGARADEGSPLLPDGHAAAAADRPVAAEAMAFDPGKGLSVESEDGDFGIELRLRAQFLYTLEHDNEAAPEEEAILHAFEIRRARLQFVGHVFGEHNKFKAEFAFSPRDMAMKDGVPRRTPILDWYLTFDHLRDLTLQLGQYKVPYSRQRVVSSGDLELVDRSLGNGEFNLDRDIGLDVRSKNFLGLDRLRYYAGVYLNAGRDAHQLKGLDMMYLARLEVLPLGGASKRWDYYEADLSRELEPRLSLGAAYAFLDDAESDQGILGKAPLDGGTTDFHNVTADVVFKVAGLSATGEFYWRRGAREFGDATAIDDAGNETPEPRVPPRDGLGYYLQLGYLVPKIPLQIAWRASWIFGAGDGTETSLPDGAELGGGLSWYFAEHPLKLQADYFRIRRDRYDAATATFEPQSWAQGSDRFRVQLQAAY